jgi:transposase-like protein
MRLKKKTTYTKAFRQQALEKVYNRGDRTVQSIADDLHINSWTLKNWMKLPKEEAESPAEPMTKRPQDRSLSERFQLILDSQGKEGETLNAWCREQGIFPHHLQAWRKDFETGTSEAAISRSEWRDLKANYQAVQRELKRKEKALAEAAALLVLQKKYQALWEEKDE